MLNKGQKAISKELRAKSREQIINSAGQKANCENPMLFVLRSKLIVFFFFLFALCRLLYVSSLEAKITGNCSNCHTMHNSQNGSSMNFDGSTTPNEVLLRATCLGCHGQGTANNIITNGSIPQVLHTNVTDLSGGNFSYITNAKARIPPGEDFMKVGHNVIDLGPSYKDTLLASPPGDQYGTGITNDNFTCAGAKGCHGDRTIEDKLLSIKGAHHTDDAVLKFGSLNESGQGSSTGLSYRFLKGVYGGEDTDWQATTGSTNHNEYKGAVDRGTESTISTPGGATISGLCAECHGNFHGPTNGDIANQNASPWLRHPIEIILPSDALKEYKKYNGGSGTNNPYSLDAPVARANTFNNTNYPTAKGTVNPGTNDAIVMCLSCHRAHASPVFKLMRWDYKGWPGCLPDCTNGCNVCHTSKK